MNAADVMTCALAREVRPTDVVGVGLGTPLALCAALVAQRLDAPEATVLVGGAVSPRATLDQCLRHEMAGRTPGYVPHLDTMDMAERQAMTLQFLRPAQVGGDGSANTSRVEANGRIVRFPGGLALADVPNLMPRIVLYHTAHEPRALPPVIGFRTAAGGGIERSGYRALGADEARHRPLRDLVLARRAAARQRPSERVGGRGRRRDGIRAAGRRSSRDATAERGRARGACGRRPESPA